MRRNERDETSERSGARTVLVINDPPAQAGATRNYRQCSTLEGTRSVGTQLETGIQN